VVCERDPTSLDDTGLTITGLQVLPEEYFTRALAATKNFAIATGSAPSTTTAANSSTAGAGSAPIAEYGSLYINDYFTIRPESDQFGRGITEVRKKLTKNDTQPFPTL
jgi:hypothetical protein